jgi:glycosyltransferase involved in cell wall biosynthesis
MNTHLELTKGTMLAVNPQLLHIMQCANLGGMERSTLELMSALSTFGCSNRLVSLNPILGLGPLLDERGIPARGLSYRGPAGMLSIAAMAREFRRGPKPDGVVMTGPNLAAFIALAGLRCKKRLLFVHYHHAGVKSRSEWRLIYAAAMRIFPRIGFCSDFIRREAEEIYPPLRRISVTQYNPYQLPPRPREEERSAVRRALGIPDGTAVVGNAGWLIQRKRWDVFLRTAAKITAQRRDVVFLACGDGPLREKLREQCRSLGLDGQVRWLGWQEDLTRFYLSLDVLLFNSDWDALCRAPLEAGAYEVPAVASCIHGGIREVISSEEVGFLLDRHDEDWLAEKTLLLLESPELRRKMGTACRTVLAEKHDPARNALEVLSLLDLNGS